jgi:hypothetical protein
VWGWLQHLPRLCISSKGISASISVSSISNGEAIAQQFFCVSMLKTERAKSESLISSMTECSRGFTNNNFGSHRAQGDNG